MNDPFEAKDFHDWCKHKLWIILSVCCLVCFISFILASTALGVAINVNSSMAHKIT